jgi:hypothetical protein
MKILAFRHWEKKDNDINGNLSDKGKEQAFELWKTISDQIGPWERLVGIASSNVHRVEDTAKHMLIWILEHDYNLIHNAFDETFLHTIEHFSDWKASNWFLKNETYLWLQWVPDLINKEFHTRFWNLVKANPWKDKSMLQDQVALWFMKWAFKSPPEIVGKPLVKKLLLLIELIHRNPKKTKTTDGYEKVIGLATHQTINEALLVTLCKWFDHMPEQWQYPFWLAESIMYEIKKDWDDKRWVLISFRWIKKRFSKEDIQAVI